jgi:S-adenosylmethionine synthetase
MITYLTSESVAPGHPDKLCDQISDAILDAHLEQDPTARVACESAISGDQVWVFGEVSSEAQVDVRAIVRTVLRRAGYRSAADGIDPESAQIDVSIRHQSPEISAAVTGTSEIGAGDQGIVYGYATQETENLMPYPIEIAHNIIRELAFRRTQSKALKPDGKAQVTVAYGDEVAMITGIVLSSQHANDVNLDQVRGILQEIVTDGIGGAIAVAPEAKTYLNPGGRFVLGGPAADAGLTGRKIIVDTYGGACRHGGGAFSGKDATKVDRSGAYAARWIAKNLVASGAANKAEVAIAYGIGLTSPVSVSVNTFGTGRVKDAQLSEVIQKAVDLRVGAVIERLGLRSPIYLPTATYGHFGHAAYSWEKLNLVGDLRGRL